MSTVFITAPNILIFDTRVEFFYIDKESLVPFGACNACGLLKKLDQFDIRTIIAEYHTSDCSKARKKDQVKHTRRLQALDEFWEFTPWEFKKRDRVVMRNILQSVLTRKNGFQ